MQDDMKWVITPDPDWEARDKEEMAAMLDKCIPWCGIMEPMPAEEEDRRYMARKRVRSRIIRWGLVGTCGIVLFTLGGFAILGIWSVIIGMIMMPVGAFLSIGTRIRE